MRIRWLGTGRLLALAGLLLSLAGCAVPAGPVASLDGTSWTVTAISGAAPAPGSRPSMSFTAETMSGTTGCNSLTAGYTLQGSAITFSTGAMTAMACAEELMRQESSYTAALAKVTKLAGDGSTMQLQDAAGQTLFALAKTPPATPRPLAGTTWQLESIRTGQTAASVISGSSVTIQINDATLSGRACNTFRAAITIDDASITVGPVTSTKMACLSDPETTQEQTVLGLLSTVTSIRITGEQLQLTGAGGGLDFTAQ